MKEGWKNKLLGQICNIKGRIGYRGYTKQDIVEPGQGAITISPSNIQNNKSTFSNCTYISWSKYEESPEIMIFDGDILFVKTGSSYGKTALVENLDEKATINPQLVVFKQITCSNKYLYYVLISNGFQEKVESVVGGSSIPTLSQKNLGQLQIPLPSLKEQQQLVQILDRAFEKIDRAIANIEQNIKNAEELFQAKLNEVFSKKGEGWEEKTLGELGKVSMCKRILKKQTTTEGGIPFYKIGTFGKEPNAFIPEEIYNEFRSKYSFPKKGDVLISASGTIGRRVVYDGEPAYFQDSNIVWIDNDERAVSNEFLYEFYGVCNWNPSKGATISRLYNDDLRRIKIFYPSLEQQKLIVPAIKELKEKTDRLTDQYRKKHENLEEFKKSLLEKAFKGELTEDKAVLEFK